MEVIVTNPKSGADTTTPASRPAWRPRDRTLTPLHVAERLQVSKRNVVRWLRMGDLRGLRSGGRWYVSKRQLDAFLEERANIPPTTRL